MKLRIDRALTTRLMWPAVRSRLDRGVSAIPILMYHSVSPELDQHRAPYYRTVTSPATFAAHLRCLKSSGFVVVSLSQAVEMLVSQSSESERIPVVITFDDGLEDFYTNAFPLLASEGMSATVFPSSGLINGRFPTGRACLSSQQIEELSRNGIEFGSHSVTHVQLVEQTAERLEQELANSKAKLEEIIGQSVRLFSFPYRFPAEKKGFVDYLQERLLANGYVAGVTTTVGRANARSNRLFLPRLPINDCDDEEFFRMKLLGGYDWFGRVQHVYKVMRSKLTGTGAWSAR